MSTSTIVTIHEEPDRDFWLTRKQALGITPAFLILTAIIALAAFLNFYQLANIGDGNLYYTAAVRSMLQSWKNFFFAAAEPGGSVTVDKPPLGLWIETASAFVFGVNGFAVVLPKYADVDAGTGCMGVSKGSGNRKTEAFAVRSAHSGHWF